MVGRERALSMTDSTRAPGRIPMPNLERIRDDANTALLSAGMETCLKTQPVADGDTMNPTVIGYTDKPRYVIKVVYPNARKHNMDLRRALTLTNEIRKRTGLPMPGHYCALEEEEGRLLLMIMELMPGEQHRLVLQRSSADQYRQLCYDEAVALHNFTTPV